MSRIECGFSGEGGGRLLQRLGPRLTVDIGYDADYDPTRPKRPPEPLGRRLPALIDTGASATCIDDAVARDLGLPAVERGRVAGIAGLADFHTYLAQVHLPAFKFTLIGRFTGVDLTAGVPGLAVLIGRDILGHFHLSYDGRTGQVVLSDPSAPAAIDAIWPDE